MQDVDTQEPFFVRDADRFVPTDASRGPWYPNSLHGRVIAGLLAFEIERQHGGGDLQPARITVDMYRPPQFLPLQISTHVVREGGRMKVVDAEMICDGTSVARANCQLLRRSDAPPGRVWSPVSDWDVPEPTSIAKAKPMRPGPELWDLRPIAGEMGTMGTKRLWMSEVRPLVDNAELTPFVRAALPADYASPFANASDQGLFYINSDVTMHLHRLPVGEWVGLEVVNHQATDGVAIGQCLLHDQSGIVGLSTVAALTRLR